MERRVGGASGRSRRLQAADTGLSSTGEVSRAALVNRLRAARSQSVLVLVAPAGYGKTTLLAQWARRDDRAFAFAPLDRRGTDSATLVGAVADALRSLGGPDLDADGASVAALASALASTEMPFVLVLDDAHALDSDASDVVTALLKRIPEGSMVVLAGRAQPLPSLPRIRAGGELLELTLHDLAFTRREARSLLRSMGIAVSDAQLDDVVERTEGWAEGVRLAGLSLRARCGDADLGGYLQYECLSTLTPEERAFARRTSILTRLSPSLCDAVLERADSVRMLSCLEGSQVILIALDRDRQWFRYHHAVRKQLRDELEEQEPALARDLERLAAAWLEANGEPERALRHACAGADPAHMAELVEAVAPDLHNDGRDEKLLEWVARLEKHAEIEDYRNVAVLAARLHAQRGDASEAERCLAAAIRGPAGRKPRRVPQPHAARIDLVCAAMCIDGVESMLTAAKSAVSVLSADDCWRPYGLLLQGTAHALLGDNDRADAILTRAEHAARRFGSRETSAVALTQRALVASAEGEGIRAGRLLDLARAEVAHGNLETYPTSALTLAMLARFELLHGHSPEAFAALAAARALLPRLGRSLPWLAVQTRLQLAGAEVALRNASAAGALLAQVDELRAACPRLGILRRRRDLLAAEIRAMPAGVDGRSVGLTGAELRLVPMLATHLSFREIGARFFLSRNTVKTQAISVYRKLGASSRSEAVERAHGLGLLEAGADSDALIQTG